ncbi:MAG TPA: CBS domain-containing protein, partial [Chthonomonadaceae bacterium]|nr:CBS domain-containing protein [Chthonomonadaceae bacterium]
MKTVSDLLRREPVWVNPAHRVETALLLMQGHDLSGLPVMEGPALVGMVLAQQLIGVERGRRVDEVMDRRVEAVGPDLSAREAADLMLRANLPLLPVMSAEEGMLGLITALDLLPALRRAVDPTTDLPWSDSMREWAIERLQAGREITLLFLDINDFGHFNKRYGHVIGDTVLRSVADILRDLVDAERDTLCRYGGDEFCIASLRNAA